MKTGATLNEGTGGARRLCTLAAAVLLIATATTWSQEQAPPAPASPQPAAEEKKAESPKAAETTKPTAETPASSTSAPATSTSAPAGTDAAATETTTEEDAHAPERFIPKEKASADKSATFPIDI